MGVLPSDSAGTPTSPAGTLTRPHCTLLTASAYHYTLISHRLFRSFLNWRCHSKNRQRRLLELRGFIVHLRLRHSPNFTSN